LIVCVIPLLFIFWKPKKLLWNIAVVLTPLCILLIGAYLTHSRGSLLALLALTLMAARRRIGTIPSLLLAVGLFIGASTLQFTGGREISATAGEGRTDLWGQSLQALATHPIFGVGFGNLSNFTDGHLTAHNTIAVCAAELGMFGMFFWCLFLFPTLRDVLMIASPKNTKEGNPTAVEESPFPHTIRKFDDIDKAEVNRLGSLLLFSLSGFLTAGWFLSRAFVMTLFLLGGMIEVIYAMALRSEVVSPRLALPRTLAYAGGMALSLVALLYVMVRAANLMH
jgi:O-antigen ligase